jgi:hypothetical protein
MAARLTTASGQQRKSQLASLITVSTVVLASGSVAQTHQISDSMMIHLDRDPFAAPLWGRYPLTRI